MCSLKSQSLEDAMIVFSDNKNAKILSFLSMFFKRGLTAALFLISNKMKIAMQNVI